MPVLIAADPTTAATRRPATSATVSMPLSPVQALVVIGVAVQQLPHRLRAPVLLGEDLDPLLREIGGDA